MLIGCLELASSSLDDSSGKIQKKGLKSDVNSRLKSDLITDIVFTNHEVNFLIILLFKPASDECRGNLLSNGKFNDF